jgi:hypothetical protein
LAVKWWVTHPELSSAIARQTVGRERWDREAAVPKVALPPIIHADRIGGTPRHCQQEVRGLFPFMKGV